MRRTPFGRRGRFVHQDFSYEWRSIGSCRNHHCLRQHAMIAIEVSTELSIDSLRLKGLDQFLNFPGDFDNGPSIQPLILEILSNDITHSQDRRSLQRLPPDLRLTLGIIAHGNTFTEDSQLHTIPPLYMHGHSAAHAENFVIGMGSDNLYFHFLNLLSRIFESNRGFEK